MPKSNPGRRNALFVSWVRFHARSLSLARELGIPSEFIYASRLPTPIRYVVQAWKTYLLLRAQKVHIIFLMLPPLPALLTVLALTRRSQTRIVADLHSGVFNDPKWRWATTITLKLLKAPHIALVTNQAMLDTCVHAGVSAVILHDPVEVMSQSAVEREHGPAAASAAPRILVPLSYAPDEPLQEILQAARGLPRYEWQLTGNPPPSLVNSAPSNVEFTGFVSNAEYAELLNRCTVLVALTTRSDTMQQAAYEALSALKPLVTSDHDVLVEYFGASALYSDPTSGGIANAVTQAVAQGDALIEQMRFVAQTRRTEHDVTLAELRTRLHLAGE